jgi:hypothetical protein
LELATIRHVALLPNRWDGGDVEKIDKTGLVSAWRQGKKEKLVDGNKRESTPLTPHSYCAAITCRLHPH